MPSSIGRLITVQATAGHGTCGPVQPMCAWSNVMRSRKCLLEAMTAPGQGLDQGWTHLQTLPG